MNSRDTIETQVNVLAKFDPKIPKNFTSPDILVLGNLDPKVQLSVVNQFEKKLIKKYMLRYFYLDLRV